VLINNKYNKYQAQSHGSIIYKLTITSTNHKFTSCTRC